MPKLRPQVLALGVLLGGSAACSSNVGEAIRPKEATATEALGAASSLEACEADYAKPLVIDISPEDRGDLEAKLKQGGPVVSFDCKSMKILPTCRMKSTEYKWVGYTPKAQLVEMESGDDLGAALPLNGMSFKAALERSGRLNLATMTVGQRSAGMLAVDRNNLEGDCANGTHVVNSVWVGAFKLETGSKGEVMAAADVFGAEAHAASKSARKSMTSDGDVSACEAAREDGTAPPPGCTAFVRIELLKIPAEGVAVASAPPGGGPGKEKPVSCSPGREWNGATCVSPEATGICSRNNLEACRPRCEKKEATACMTLAEHAMREKNRADAKLYTEKACNYGLGTGCQFRVVVEEDEQNALPWMEKGCAIGEPWSCAVSGGMHLKRGDAAKGFVYATRSCDLGDADGCNLLAKMYLKGEGTTKNGLKAIAIHEKQCKAGWVNACEAGAKELEEGKNVKKDLGAAEKILVMACDASNANAQHANVRGVGCLWLASFYERRSDAAKATKAYEQACSIAKLPAACNKVAKN